jgi:osmoprotectant transport system substrate-binding protein
MPDIDKGCGPVRGRTARRGPAGRTLVHVPRSRKVLSATTVAFAVMCGACTPASGGALSEDRPGAGQHGSAIVVGSFDFPESVLLANIYGGGLAAHGFPVRILPGLGTRELVDPALMSGLVQVVPEYAGSALQFISLGRLPPTSGIDSTNRVLTKLAAGQGLVAGRPAAAQDANAIVVTAATAARYDLRSIADLARVAPRLVFGGPPECPRRSYCLPGLRRTYGLHFKSFVPLDAGGPLTLQALEAGNIGVALLFTTDPAIPARHLVVLADNRGLQPAENITPLVLRDAVARHGPGLMAVLNTVSARLGTASLRALNARVEIHGQNPRQVAENWLRAQGLVPGGRAYR